MVKIIFFSLQDASSPVTDFIDRCQIKQQVKILRLLKYVEEFGLTKSIPNSRKLTGTPLWELRILGKDNIRLIYASIGRNTVVILHIFMKRKQKTPTKEIAIALKRYQLIVDK